MNFNPNWVSATGNTILDILQEKDISIKLFSERMDKDEYFVVELLKGNHFIDYELACKLKDLLGFTVDFWINRDQIYRERNQKLVHAWINNLPIKEMKAKKIINDVDNIIQSCFSFFGVDNLIDWNIKYGNQINSLAFRKSNAFQTDLYAVAIWVRQAEILTKDYKIKKWNKALFESKLISEIKPLSRNKNPQFFIPKLIEICAECGVRLAIVPTLEKNRASGATKLMDDNTALMILSCRFLTDDHFWFTFFHEAGHLIMHSGNILRLESGNYENSDDEEKEANLFAEECLIPFELSNEIHKLKSNTKRIISFSLRANISPGILIGQMQHKKLIGYNYLNSFKRRYNWDDIFEGLKKVTFH